ncbi:cAMP dependent protein kinase [Vararia minispora EC-137]|uniref:cAMP dependent protein kinase n=1 Tax=Vararia minispora EC-137 TaxID=1314806 RepID=A0ACB8QWQ6_9AGAM|nr:cAMP dependent protein kinase [Vararia minispora EC-137]
MFCSPSRKPSTVRVIDGPLTPPMSPDREQKEDLLDSDIDPDTMDDQPSPIAKSSRPPSPDPSLASKDDTPMSIDDSPSSPSRPLHNLEDEPDHLHRDLRLTDFDVKGTLGTGTFGRVLLVRHRLSPPGNNAVFALKVMPKTEIIRLRQVEHVKAERHILSRVHHPFIVDLYATFQDKLNIYMLLSYVPGGELFTHLRRVGRFTPDVTRFYLAIIILALRFLHSYNIVYRDLKPENLLLDSRGYLRLTDFGFAKVVDDRTWTLCGTPEYLAPEIIQSDGHGKPADWWACGVLAYEMMVGYPPFFDETPYGIYERILNGHINWPRDMDPLSRELIRGFLNPDRSKRLGNLTAGAEDVLQHPWFRGVDWAALERREIRAPIVPHVAAPDDTRYFARLPLPPSLDIPGLVAGDHAETSSKRLSSSFNVIDFQFADF